MIIDAHTHICTNNTNPIASVDHLLEEMRAANTDAAIVFPLSDAFSANKELVDAIKGHSNLIPLAFINPNEKEALSQFKQCIEEYGMRGLKIHPTLSNFHIDDRSKLHELFSCYDEHRLNIVIHCTSDDHRVHPYRIETMAKCYPHATFQIAHMGAIWCADQAIETAKRNDNIYLDTGIASFNALRRAMNEVPDKVLMGADFPFYLYEMEQIKVKKAAEYSQNDTAEVFRLVAGENCRKLYRIEEKR